MSTVLIIVGFRQAGFVPDEGDLEMLANENNFHDELPPHLPQEFEQRARLIHPADIHILNATDAYLAILQGMSHFNIDQESEMASPALL